MYNNCEHIQVLLEFVVLQVQEELKVQEELQGFLVCVVSQALLEPPVGECPTHAGVGLSVLVLLELREYTKEKWLEVDGVKQEVPTISVFIINQTF